MGALDTQGDGLLTAEELAEAARRVGHELPLEELREIVAALDASGQGRIGYKEFAAALVQRGMGLDELRLQECFRKFDSSSSGQISYEDVNKVLCSGDGSIPGITPSEWEEIVNPSSTDNGQRHKDTRDSNHHETSVELTLEAFMVLMLSQDGKKNGHGQPDDDEAVWAARYRDERAPWADERAPWASVRRSSPMLRAVTPPDAPSECPSEFSNFSPPPRRNSPMLRAVAPPDSPGKQSGMSHIGPRVRANSPAMRRGPMLQAAAPPETLSECPSELGDTADETVNDELGPLRAPHHSSEAPAARISISREQSDRIAETSCLESDELEESV